MQANHTVLCLDFGNTLQKAAIFTNGQQTAVQVIEPTVAAVEQLINQYQPSKALLSSVITHDVGVEELLAKKTVFHKLNHLSNLPITSPVGKPETIGADRLALVSAAVHLFPHQHTLVIGMGSCITYNFVNKYHEFLGGSISPGMQMRFRAMNQYTALLPMVEPENNFPLIGYDTKTNLLSGVIIGITAEIDAFITLYSQKYSNFNAVLTGGDAPYFVPRLKNKIFADPNLLFKGLYAICEKNV